MTNEIILESLAMDLKRVALGLHRGSYAMANRFTQEALARKREVNKKSIKDYVVQLLDDMELSLTKANNERKAEDALMYSTLFQNAALQMKE